MNVGHACQKVKGAGWGEAVVLNFNYFKIAGMDGAVRVGRSSILFQLCGWILKENTFFPARLR
jgi:hypothetical protein